MALSDTRQRSMPTMRDVKTGQELAYPEAVLLTKPHNPQFRGEVGCTTFFNLISYSLSCMELIFVVLRWMININTHVRT